jgi:hypothetical protein
VTRADEAGATLKANAERQKRRQGAELEAEKARFVKETTALTAKIQELERTILDRDTKTVAFRQDADKVKTALTAKIQELEQTILDRDTKAFAAGQEADRVKTALTAKIQELQRTIHNNDTKTVAARQEADKVTTALTAKIQELERTIHNNDNNNNNNKDPGPVSVPYLLRVWHGKYKNKRPVYIPMEKKTSGCAVGFWAREEHSQKVKIYLAKSGFPGPEHQVSETLSTRRQMHYRSFLGIVKEKIAADIYAILGHGYFYVPKHRLEMMKVLNEYTKENALAVALTENMNAGRKAADQIHESLHLLSRRIKGYQDLAALRECFFDHEDAERKSFLTCVELGRVPEYALIQGQRLPILGLMEVMAASRLLGDTDVLGGGGKNAGFVIEINGDQPVAVRITKIDAGESFNFDGANNQFMQSFNRKFRGNKLQDQKDMQFGNMQPKVIQWSKLLDQQQKRFLCALKRGYHALQNNALLDLLLFRKGLFDQAIPGPRKLLGDDMVSAFKASWREYMNDQMLPEVYGESIETMNQITPSFSPKDVGAANITLAIIQETDT